MRMLGVRMLGLALAALADSGCASGDGAQNADAWSWDAALEVASVTTPRTGGTHRVVVSPGG